MPARSCFSDATAPCIRRSRSALSYFAIVFPLLSGVGDDGGDTLAGQNARKIARFADVEHDDRDLIVAAQRHRARVHHLQIVGEHAVVGKPVIRSEEHTSELQSLMRSSYAVF